MTSIRDIAEQFFDACETGKGWDGCAQYCHPGATFAAQVDALDGIETLEAYTEWMKGLLIPLPDGNAEVRSFAVDEARNNVAPFLVGGTGPPSPVCVPRKTPNAATLLRVSSTANDRTSALPSGSGISRPFIHSV